MRVNDRRSFALPAPLHGPVMASYDSSGSLPSTSSSSKFGKLHTSFETEPPAVCTSTGTEIAYLLSSIRNRTGSLRLLALLSASHHSPSLVVPSPAEQ